MRLMTWPINFTCQGVLQVEVEKMEAPDFYLKKPGQ